MKTILRIRKEFDNGDVFEGRFEVSSCGEITVKRELPFPDWSMPYELSRPSPIATIQVSMTDEMAELLRTSYPGVFQ